MEQQFHSDTLGHNLKVDPKPVDNKEVDDTPQPDLKSASKQSSPPKQQSTDSPFSNSLSKESLDRVIREAYERGRNTRENSQVGSTVSSKGLFSPATSLVGPSIIQDGAWGGVSPFASLFPNQNDFLTRMDQDKTEKQQQLQETLQNAVRKAAEEKKFEEPPTFNIKIASEDEVMEYTRRRLAEFEREEMNLVPSVESWKQTSDVGNLSDVDVDNEPSDKKKATRAYVTAKANVTRCCNTIMKEIDQTNFSPYEFGAKLEKSIDVMVNTGRVAIALSCHDEIDKVRQEFSERTNTAVGVLLELQKMVDFLNQQAPPQLGLELGKDKPSTTSVQFPASLRAGPETETRASGANDVYAAAKLKEQQDREAAGEAEKGREAKIFKEKFLQHTQQMLADKVREQLKNKLSKTHRKRSGEDLRSNSSNKADFNYGKTKGGEYRAKPSPHPQKQPLRTQPEQKRFRFGNSGNDRPDGKHQANRQWNRLANTRGGDTTVPPTTQSPPQRDNVERERPSFSRLPTGGSGRNEPPSHGGSNIREADPPRREGGGNSDNDRPPPRLPHRDGGGSGRGSPPSSNGGDTDDEHRRRHQLFFRRDPDYEDPDQPPGISWEPTDDNREEKINRKHQDVKFDDTSKTVNWFKFKAAFVAAVGCRRARDEEKLLHLLGLLEGAPAALAHRVAGDEYNRETYAEVWRKLEEAYGGQERKRYRLYQDLHNWPKITEFTHKNTLELTVLIANLIRAYTDYYDGRELDSAGMINISVQNLLPPQEARRYFRFVDRERREKNLFTMYEFLECERKALASAAILNSKSVGKAFAVEDRYHDSGCEDDGSSSRGVGVKESSRPTNNRPKGDTPKLFEKAMITSEMGLFTGGNQCDAIRTIPVYIVSSTGQKERILAALDSCSTSTNIDADTARRLNLKIEEASIDRNIGVLQSSVKIPSDRVSFTLQSLDGKSKFPVQAYTVKNLIEGTPVVDWQQVAEEYPHLQGAKPSKAEPKDRVRVLLGVDQNHLMIASANLQGRHNEPFAEYCKLGWSFSGRVKREHVVNRHIEGCNFTGSFALYDQSTDIYREDKREPLEDNISQTFADSTFQDSLGVSDTGNETEMSQKKKGSRRQRHLNVLRRQRGAVENHLIQPNVVCDCKQGASRLAWFDRRETSQKQNRLRTSPLERGRVDFQPAAFSAVQGSIQSPCQGCQMSTEGLRVARRPRGGGTPHWLVKSHTHAQQPANLSFRPNRLRGIRSYSESLSHGGSEGLRFPAGRSREQLDAIRLVSDFMTRNKSSKARTHLSEKSGFYSSEGKVYLRPNSGRTPIC